MSFTLPQEYTDFVSDKDSLLKEVQLNPVTDDFCLLQIFFVQKLDLISVLKKRNELTDWLTKLFYRNGSTPYLWHESRELSLVVCGNESEWYVSAVLKYGDYIEDEWFLTYLAIKLSEMDDSLMIRLFDNDGEFLLIEAAEVLDDWINPDIATNRVWIIDGKIYFLPLTMSNHGELTIQTSLAYLREQINHNSLADILANNQIQRAIQAKTTDLYPHRCRALDHYITAIVPRWVAYALQDNATIVGAAVSSLSSIESVNISKRVQPIHVANNDDLVVRSIRMSKAQYAQLTFKQFKMPRKYHSQMRRMADAQSAKVTKAFDLGCRLLCGLELVVANDQDNKPELDEFRRVVVENVNKNLTEIESAKFNVQSPVVYFPSSNSVDMKNMIGLISSKQPSISEIIASSVSSMPINEPSESDRDLFAIVKQGNLRWDSDDWMYLSPEEFDKRMNSITEAATKAADVRAEENKEISPDITAASSSITKTDNLQSIVDGFKSFLLDSSEMDGVTTSSKKLSKSSNKKLPVSDSNNNRSSHKSTDGKLYYGQKSFTGRGFQGIIDIDYLRKIIQNPSVSSAVCADDNIDVEVLDVAYAGIAKKLCVPNTLDNGEENALNSDDESDHDSDDISTGSNEEDDDSEEESDDFGFEQFQDQVNNEPDEDEEYYSMEDIQRAMDSELLSEDAFMNTFQSLLSKTGGNMNGFDPSNFNEDEMDEQFLSNFLNAHAEGLGAQLGPFQQILSQLGLELPRPPPVNSMTEE